MKTKHDEAIGPPRLFRRNRSCCFVVVFSLLNATAFALHARAAEPPTLSAVAAGLTATERAIYDSDSFNLIYARETPENITPTMFSGDLVPVEIHVAHQRPSRWYTCLNFLKQENTRSNYNRLPIIRMAKDGMSLDWLSASGRCVIDPVDQSINYFLGWEYVQQVGLNPFRPIIQTTWKDDKQLKGFARGASLYLDLEEPLLPDALEKYPNKYKVQSEPETVDGISCWVVEWPGMDKFWIDPAHGFAIHRRIIHWGEGKPRKREVVNRDFREVKPGLWLPFEQTVDQYSKIAVEATELWDKVANRAIYRVQTMEFNKDLSSLFDIQLPPQTVVHDFVRKLEYAIPAEGADPFEEPIERGREHLSRWSAPRKWAIALTSVVVCVLFFLIWRKRTTSLIAALVLVIAAGGSAAVAQDQSSVNESQNGLWMWKPYWRSNADCGPNALFVLLRLQNVGVSWKSVSDRVHCDPVLGCSMENLREAANELGLPADIEFIPPNELHNVSFPFILHGQSSLKEQTGHFIVVVDRDDEGSRYSVIDPVREMIGWYPERTVLQGYSGYLLVPKTAARSFASKFLIGFLLISGLFLAIWGSMKGRKAPQATTLVPTSATATSAPSASTGTMV